MNQPKRRLLVSGFMGCLLVALSLVGCSSAPEGWPNKPGKRVMASFPPIYCFVQNVAGEDANVQCLTTTSPHDYEVQFQDALAVRGADLFFCNGLELDEDNVNKLVKKASRKADIVVQLGEAVPHEDLLHIEEEEHPKGKDEKHDHHHHHGEHDPHIWLSPAIAAHMVDRVAESLSKIDPAHKEGFMSRAAAYKKELKELHGYGLSVLGGKKNRKVITQHDSLKYFARAFDIDVVGEIRTQSGHDISPAERAKLAELAKKHQVTAITHEVQYSESEAANFLNTLKNLGVSANLVKFDTLETAENSASLTPDFYVRMMRKNIDNLAKALQ